MVNNFTASFEEIWAAEQQRVFHRKNVAKAVADMSFQSLMSKGDTLNRPYRSSATVQTYTPGTAITIDDLTDTNEALTVNRKFATGFYVDNFDQIQDKYDIAAAYGRDHAIKLSNKVDADILGEVTNATSTLDDGDLGGTAGNGISLTTSNVLATFAAAKRLLAKQQMESDDYFAVISPEVEEILIQYTAGRDTSLGDKAQENGRIGGFLGFDLFRSNNTTGTAVLAMATQPTDGDTVVINGVTFTFKTTLGAVAGNVLIGASADAARVNLEGLINNPGTTDSEGVALSAANQRVFEGATATDSASLNTLTVVFKGLGALVVSETFTDATDEWTAAKTVQHQMFGVKGAPTIVVQSEPQVLVREVQDKLGRNILNGVLYGVKTFADNAKMMVDVQVAASSFAAPQVA